MGLIGQIALIRVFPAAIKASTNQIFRVEPVQLFRHEQAVFTDKLIVKADLAAAVFRALDADHVPVDLAAVAVVGFLVGLARREMEGAGDLLVEEDVLHRLQDVGVEAERELADVAGALDRYRESRSACFGWLPVASTILPSRKSSRMPIEGRALIERRGVEIDVPCDGILHRAGKNFAVGNVALAAAGNGADALDTETQVGAGPLMCTRSVCCISS